MSTSPVIQMEDVAAPSMHETSKPAVEHVNWTVEQGDFWAIAGLHGSGKANFLMMTAGLMAPTVGRYRLLGEEMPIFDEARLPHRLRLGMVFEGGQLLNHLTIRENVALPVRYHRNLTLAEAEPAVYRLLEATELVEWAESTPGGISRSWQRRGGLARALSLQPEVLLLDDPLAGLDLRHWNWWMAFLAQLSKGSTLTQGRPMTIVITTADLAIWKGRATKFAILKDRRLTTLGEWERVQERDDLVHEVLGEG